MVASRSTLVSSTCVSCSSLSSSSFSPSTREYHDDLCSPFWFVFVQSYSLCWTAYAMLSSLNFFDGFPPPLYLIFLHTPLSIFSFPRSTQSHVVALKWGVLHRFLNGHALLVWRRHLGRGPRAHREGHSHRVIKSSSWALLFCPHFHFSWWMSSWLCSNLLMPFIFLLLSPKTSGVGLGLYYTVGSHTRACIPILFPLSWHTASWWRSPHYYIFVSTQIIHVYVSFLFISLFLL